MKFLLLLLLALPGLVMAQESYELPALYDVSGVETGESLNVRAGPFPAAQKLGELAGDAAGVEVLGFNGDRSWGKVNFYEFIGWVPMSFLARQEGQVPGNKLPVPLYCAGTEPFWSLTITQTDALFDNASGPESGAVEDAGEDEDAAPGPIPLHYLGALMWSPRGGFAAGDLTGFVSREACSDGMSNREYGFRVDFLRAGEAGHTAFSGCCSLAR